MSESQCPICEQPADFFCEKLKDNIQWNIHRCRSCGHGFVANRPTPQQLLEMYAIDESHELGEEVDPDLRGDCIQMVKQIRRLGGKAGRSLDIGSGDGGFSYHLAKAGYTPLMIDHGIHAEKAAAAIPRASFWRIGFEEYASDPSKPRPLDAIIMSQVLEHALDPMDWLRRAKRLLARDGILVVAIPNFGGIYRLRGPKDPFIIPPQHLNYFTPKSIELAVTKAGMKFIARRYRSQIANAHPLHKLSFKRKAIGMLWNCTPAPMIDLIGQGIILIAYATTAD